MAPSAPLIGSVIINDSSFMMNGEGTRGELASTHIGVFTVVGENYVITSSEFSKALSPPDAVEAGLTIEPGLIIGDFCHIGASVNLES